MFNHKLLMLSLYCVWSLVNHIEIVFVNFYLFFARAVRARWPMNWFQEHILDIFIFLHISIDVSLSGFGCNCILIIAVQIEFRTCHIAFDLYFFSARSLPVMYPFFLFFFCFCGIGIAFPISIYLIAFDILIVSKLFMQVAEKMKWTKNKTKTNR